MAKKKTLEQVLKSLHQRNLAFPPITPVVCEYHNSTTKSEWFCTQGHFFFTTWKNILNGHGCKKCSRAAAGNKNTKSVEVLQERLIERNARFPDKLVSIKTISEYEGMTKPLTWTCTNQHEWSATPKTVLLKGTYCRICADIENANNQRFTTSQIVARIQEHNTQHPQKHVNIKELNTYQSNKSKISVECEHGHRWSTALGNIIDAHAGCPICTKSQYSAKAIVWLDEIATRECIDIQHAANGGEYAIPNSRFLADGFCMSTNTIYEFHGDIFHGNPALHNPTDISPLTGNTFGVEYQKTKEREQWIISQGYNLVVIWEQMYDATIRHETTLSQIINFLERYDVKVSRTSQYDLFLDDFNIAINYRCLVLHTHAQVNDVRYHIAPHEHANQTNTRLITIFSHEWYYSKKKVKDSLRYFIGHADKGIMGRKCIIKPIEWAPAKAFLNEYHLLNSGAPATYALGAFDADKLVAVMTFGRPAREQGKADYFEMTRFVTDKQTHAGLASKMFKFAVKTYSFTKIIAFVDKRWFTGVFKTISGFVKIADTNPTMWYTDGKHLFNRRFISKSRLLDELKLPTSTTKNAMLLGLGYEPMYDCGKIKLRWTNTVDK